MPLYSQRLPDPFLLRIGSLVLSISCPDLAWLDQIRLRFGDFAGSGDANLRISILIDKVDGASSLLDISPVFDDGAMRLVSPGVSAWIDPKRGIGEISLPSDRLIEQVEYFLRLAVALLAYESGGLLVHAAAIVHRGVGRVFFGHSGSGKSTVARLSSEGTPDAIVLNDDLVLLLPAASGWRVFSTPFWNQPAPRASAESAQLGSLFRLVQDRRVFLERLPASLAVAEILTSLPVVSADPARSSGLLDRCQDLLECTPTFRLHFLPDFSFWTLLDGEI